MCWSMENNIVAYVGYHSFDIILYLSRILHKLGRKVLIIDNSDTAALKTSIPQIPLVNSDNSIITYRHVDFTRKSIAAEEMGNYDDILIDYGMNTPKSPLSLLTRIVFVTDMYEFNMDRLAGLKYYDDLKIEKELLIREGTNTKFTPDYIMEKIEKRVSADNISVLFRDDDDYENVLLCHYNKVFRFTNISGLLRKYLINEIKILCINETDKNIKAAYKKARKGD